MDILSIRIEGRHRKDMGDIKALAASIAEVGLLHPVVVTPDGRLIAGQRRLEAVKSLGWQSVPVTVVDLQSIVQGEYAENVERKAFAPTEAVAIGSTLEELEKQKARERLAVRSENFTEVNEAEKGRALDKVAATVGMSRPTYQKAKAVVDAAEADPVTFGAIAERMDETGKVDGAYREIQKIKRDELPKPKQPLGTYSVIYADPPWAYDNSGFAQSAASHYPTMPTQEIAALPIGNLCTVDTVLFLWATSPLLPEALGVIEAWGFEYKASMVWDKGRAPGMGWFVQTQHELLLIATRDGNPHPLIKPVSVMRFEAGEHSAKPHEVYAIIESMYVAPYIELFARHAHEGWGVWGNEV